MVDKAPESITELFYLVKSLVPPFQQLSTIPHDMPVMEAIKFMQDMGYSQLPVMSWDEMLGVFSYRSFCKAIVELDEELEPNETYGDMTVGEFINQHRFVDYDDNWESILRHLDKDGSVLVGNRDDPRGLLTYHDVVNFLYKVAKPFLVIAEIELSIRRVITNCVDEVELQTCIQNSLSDKYPKNEYPEDVSAMTFNDYVQIICDGRNWLHFQQFFGESRGMRRRWRNYLTTVGELRNDAFHFRRSLSEDDIQFLNNKRDLLQRKARIYEGDQRRVEAEIRYVAQPATE
jgi:CBS domain-containing protein